jgi:hypothetical protein
LCSTRSATKRGRVEHAQQRVKRSKAPRPREPNLAASAAANDADASAAGRRGEYAKEEAISPTYAETATQLFIQPTEESARASTAPISSCADHKALAEFKYAVHHWLSMMSYEAKCEAVNYVIKKSGVRVP